jgi:hypothetical protein
MEPNIRIANQTRDEKNDKAEHRRKLKMWSFFMTVALIIKSAKKVRRINVAPNKKPLRKLSTDKSRTNKENIPP